MLKYAIGIVIGGIVGGLMGSSRSCETGACPLTSNPYVGAIYGAVLGFFLVSALFGATVRPGTSGTQTSKEGSVMAANGNGSVVQITSKAAFQDQVLNASVPVLVDLWASWCGPCRAQMPIVEQVAQQAGDRARVVKVNVDDVADVAQDLGVDSIPTLVVFKDGKEQKRFVGVQSADILSRALGV